MVSAAALRPLSWLSKPVKAAVRPFPKLNAALWNTQYRLGMWNYLDAGSDGPQALAVIQEFSPNPKILDLGCGTSVNLPLLPGGYRLYHGVDISATAISRGRALGRPNTSFEVADILRYRTAERYNAILLREVIYYFALDEVAGLLDRLVDFLEPGGKIYVSLWTEYAHAPVADIVRNCGLAVVHERSWDAGTGGVFIVLAGRPGYQVGAAGVEPATPRL
jgi:SAM-dependent methyltransferase